MNECIYHEYIAWFMAMSRWIFGQPEISGTIREAKSLFEADAH